MNSWHCSPYFRPSYTVQVNPWHTFLTEFCRLALRSVTFSFFATIAQLCSVIVYLIFAKKEHIQYLSEIRKTYILFSIRKISCIVNAFLCTTVSSGLLDINIYSKPWAKTSWIRNSPSFRRHQVKNPFIFDKLDRNNIPRVNSKKILNLIFNCVHKSLK